MNLDQSSVVYCDAAFLVTYFIKNSQQPDLHKRAESLFGQMLFSKCQIITSPLAFDETWNGIRKSIGPKIIKNRFKYVFNQLLLRTPFQLRDGGVLQYSYDEALQRILNSTSIILNCSKFFVTQLIDPMDGVLKAANRLNKLKPRDSFHLTIALDNNATHFISRDIKLLKEASGSGLIAINFTEAKSL